MKNPFKKGDLKVFEKVIGEKDLASFDSGMVHPVYATFALARDAEWACRLFVLEMKEDHEEGIGTMLTVEHLSPALKGETVKILAWVDSISGNEIICNYEARAGDRLIARGRQGQKILKKQSVEKLFAGIRQNKQ